MAVCSQNLTLGALSSRSALSTLVGALFQKCNVRQFFTFVAVASKLRIVSILIIVGPPATFQYTRYISMFTAYQIGYAQLQRVFDYRRRI
jgi:hypothetical protein